MQLTTKAELGISEERFHLLVDSVVDYAIFMLDPEGFVVSWNRGAKRIKGYSAKEIIGRHFSVFYTPEDIARNHPKEELAIAIKEGRFEEEGWRVRKDGTRFWANVLITAIFDNDSALKGFAKVTRDMTERRKMEEQLRELNRQLESFAYSVAHDLRAPLRNIVFTAQMLIEDYHDKVDDEGKKMLSSLSDSATKLARIITELLTLSRIARAPLKRQKVNLSEIAAESWRQVLERHAGLNPRFDIQPEMLAHGDPTLLAVALMNLIDNAIKFSPNGAHVSFGTVEQNGKRVFFLRDEGIGFDMIFADKVFIPFERLVGDEKFGGSGIGLANVQQAIQRHGGTIWVESEPGVGTTFYFTLS